jgi:hypothetical protein
LRRKRGSFFCGFDAGFVGDRNGFGALPVSLFFPLGPAESGTTVMGGCGGRTVGEMIPHVPLGELADDVRGFDDDGFLVIEVGDDSRTVVKRNEDGSLFVQPLEGNPALDEIMGRARVRSGSRGAGPPPEKAKVPWPDFVLACYRAMDRWVPNTRLCPDSSWTSGMGNFLAELNEAPVPSKYDGWVFWMAFYQYLVGQMTGFLTKIRKVHKDLMEKLDVEIESQ